MFIVWGRKLSPPTGRNRYFTCRKGDVVFFGHESIHLARHAQNIRRNTKKIDATSLLMRQVLLS